MYLVGGNQRSPKQCQSYIRERALLGRPFSSASVEAHYFLHTNPHRDLAKKRFQIRPAVFQRIIDMAPFGRRALIAKIFPVRPSGAMRFTTQSGQAKSLTDVRESMSQLVSTCLARHLYPSPGRPLSFKKGQ
jgi:hypothetical protein